MILNRTKHYYENDKKRLREQAREKYRNLSDKNKNREYGRNRYHNISEEKKQELKKCQKNYQEAKNLNLIIKIFYGFNSVSCDLVILYQIHNIYII